MDTTYLSLPAKRTIHLAAGGMSDPNKRLKHLPPSPNQHQHQLPVPPGHVCFRLLCHSSRVGGVIGKSGSIVKQLQQQTGAKIRVEEAPAECPDRVISVVAPGVVNSGEIDCSKAQEALVRVFERILEVAAETDGGSIPAGRVVSCKLLADGSHAGSVIGKGGKVVQKIQKDCGARIKVMRDKLPLCAASTEEMIEIEGELIGVKKALVAVSRCLQDSQLFDRTRMTGSKAVEVVPQEYFPQARLDVLSQHTSLLAATPNISTSYISGGQSLSLESEKPSNQETRELEAEVSFRILCSSDRVGGVIGKGGSIIQALQNETGASVIIGPTVSDCDERLITVAASENPESRYSAAQKAAVLVFTRIVDAGIEKRLEGSLNGSSVTARMVVSTNQVGCLLGKGGVIISEMCKVTGASIRVLGRGQQLPMCVPKSDQVVQVISGDLIKVRDAMYHVTGRLRDNLFSSLRSTSMTRTPISTGTNAYESQRNISRIPLREPLREPSRESFIDQYKYPSGDPPRESFSDPYRHSSGDSSGEYFTDPYRYPLGDRSRKSFTDPYSYPSGEQLRESFIEPLREPLGGSFRDPIRDHSRDRLRDQLTDPIPLSSQFSVGTSHSLGRHSNLAHSLDHLGFSHVQDRPLSPKTWTPQMKTGENTRGFADISRGLSSFKGGLHLASSSKSAIVTNTTVEIAVPESIIDCVYGENGNNLVRLRQISGAKVIVHEPRVGSSDRIIVISGTPDETQAAQSLLQAFILTGQT
ncbi:unnamed protein product [Linum tenue]|uniref:K Homology domain-containing protein n=1 Tax=Linum tenue TaxID=586396 RepID=A0AAV0MQ04_9ROSI|nr:unnamed protein product [Linum tenue]